ncbi:calcium-binding protein [Azotobacter salinestris]|uniref:calcium-binding protein n=1 Tax=Azotobacter salinestris TaxID=69964 RepID=UPI0032DF65ED
MASRFRRDMASEATRLDVDDYRLFIGTDRTDRFEPREDGMNFAFGRHGADYLPGSDRDDDLLGGAGSDYLDGGDGADHLDGGEGADILLGQAKADTLRGAEGRDWLDEGDGHGDLEGGAGNDILIGGRGGDAFMVDPSSGHDLILDFQAGPGIFDHLALHHIHPDDLDFEQTAAGTKVSWNAGQGSVLLVGVDKGELAQDDFMFTEDNHLLPVGGAYAMDDLARAAPPTRAAPPSRAEPLTEALQDTDDADFRFDEFNVRIGDAGRDVFAGTAARDYYLGLAGDDDLSGSDGDDDLRGDAGNDHLDGGPGMDDLRGGDGDDWLEGGTEADNLMGGSGNDTLSAGAGHDMLEGGSGDDSLDGGDGADAFIVSRDSGHDLVVGGFTVGPGAFDHIAFKGLGPQDITIAEDGADTLVSWTEGSIRLAGIARHDMAQDDFMFDADTGVNGAFVDDPAITTEGSALLFPEASGISFVGISLSPADWPLA